MGEDSAEFWPALQALVDAHAVIIDRPRGTPHPRYPDAIYPFDYGYLAGVDGADGGGLDVWRAAPDSRLVTGFLCTADALKGDVEIKLLLGCSPAQMEQIAALHNQGLQTALLIPRHAGS